VLCISLSLSLSLSPSLTSPLSHSLTLPLSLPESDVLVHVCVCADEQHQLAYLLAVLLRSLAARPFLRSNNKLDAAAGLSIADGLRGCGTLRALCLW
jgi:hypothetical protein